MKKKISIAYLAETSDAAGNRTLRFNDLIPYKQREFILLDLGDIVLTIKEHLTTNSCADEWALKNLYRVSEREETGDALVYSLELIRTFSGDKCTLFRKELLQGVNWVPSPAVFFKPFPFAVWDWLVQTKGVPLPSL